VKDEDAITSLNWRAGEWPGYLEIKTTSGRVIQTPKVYYNFLIPFFVTQTSLQSMDFANEFADLAVGDAWSPVFESQGGGHSITVTRSPEMEAIISEMSENGWLEMEVVDSLKASDMHGHMLDFKKRGGWLRNQWRRKTGRQAPDYGYCPAQIPFSRICVECVISMLFAVGKTRFARWIVSQIPEAVIGPIFNNLRLGWKKASRPTKRKGLANFEVKITS
jgi:coenzyme F420 hydrogenase subunit beta